MRVTGGFSPEQVRRYSRHVLLPDVGGRGQERLLAATVSVAVDGTAGRLAAAYLVAAGVGTVALAGAVDRPVAADDAVFPLEAGDVGQPLGRALAVHLRARNPDVTVVEDGAARAVHLALADAADLPLAHAFARAGEATARLVHHLATETP